MSAGCGLDCGLQDLFNTRNVLMKFANFTNTFMWFCEDECRHYFYTVSNMIQRWRADIKLALLVESQKPTRAHRATLCCCLFLPKSCCAGSLIIWQLSETRGGGCAEISACVFAEPPEHIPYAPQVTTPLFIPSANIKKVFLGHMSWRVGLHSRVTMTFWASWSLGHAVLGGLKYIFT